MPRMVNDHESQIHLARLLELANAVEMIIFHIGAVREPHYQMNRVP